MRGAGNTQRLGIVGSVRAIYKEIKRVSVIENRCVELRDMVAPNNIGMPFIMVAEPNDRARKKKEKKPYEDRCDIFTSGVG